MIATLPKNSAPNSEAAAKAREAEARHSEAIANVNAGQNAKAAEIKLASLRRREPAVEALIIERDAATVAAGELRRKLGEVQAANSVLKTEAELLEADNARLKEQLAAALKPKKG